MWVLFFWNGVEGWGGGGVGTLDKVLDFVSRVLASLGEGITVFQDTKLLSDFYFQFYRLNILRSTGVMPSRKVLR